MLVYYTDGDINMNAINANTIDNVLKSMNINDNIVDNINSMNT